MIKSATSLFNLFCSNVARQVARFLLPVSTHPKFGSSQEKFDNWPRPKSYIALMLCEVILTFESVCETLRVGGS